MKVIVLTGAGISAESGIFREAFRPIDGAMAKGYESRMTTTLSAKGSIEIPEVFRKVDALEAGQLLEIERVGHGEYRVVASGLVSRDDQEGSLVDVLLSCPVKDFFAPMERNETTNDLKPVGFE